MQQLPQRLPASGKVALRYGLIFGGAIGLIDILYSVILDTTHPGFLDSLAQALPFRDEATFNTVYMLIVSSPIDLLLLVAFLLAGLFAARQDNKVSAGLLAGLWAALLFVAIDLLITTFGLEVLILFPQIQQQNQVVTAAWIEQSILSATFSYGIVAGLVLIGLGLGIGALGGAMGKGKTLPQLAHPSPQLAYPPPQYQPYQAYQPYQTPHYVNRQPFPPVQQPPPGQFPPGTG